MNRKHPIAALLCVLLILFSLVSVQAEDVDTDDPVPVTFEELKTGDTGEMVDNLQARLVETGYLAAASGKYDQATADAVKAVQANYGIEETGIADDDTQEVIFGNCYLPLKAGDTGNLVSALQTRLKEKSLYSGEITGNYDATTQQAVSMFQQLYSLEVNGDADIETLTLLNSDLSEREIFAAPTATPKPPITVYTETVPYKKKLAYGSKGADVQKVQERLKELGYFTYKKTTTGFFKNTLAAVKAFQKNNGLPETGIVNEDTWNVLFNDQEVATVNDAPRPSPEPTPVPYAMDVDVRNQVVKVYTYDENKEYTVLTRVMICSTGTTKYPSKPGTYVLSGRKARWCTFPKWGGGTAQFWTKIDDNIAFHSIMYVNDNPDNPNMSTFNHLGSRASHGCIRLHTTDAKWVYDNCGAGTVVTIHNDGNTDKELAAFAKYRKSNAGNTVIPASSYDFDAEPPAYQRLRSRHYGMTVFWLQKTLEKLGYFKDTTATGYYGPLTQSAVKRFQKANKLSADGVMNEKTYNKLVEIQKKQQIAAKAQR